MTSCMYASLGRYGRLFVDFRHGSYGRRFPAWVRFHSGIRNNSSMYYNQLSALPQPKSAQFLSQSSLRIVFSVRDHERNVKRVVTKSVALPPPTISTALEDVPNDIVLSLVSPSRSFRAILRDASKTGGSGRFVEIWNNDRLVACRDVTRAHGQFYSDEFISSIAFSPSETSLLYIAEKNPPSSSDDAFSKFRYTPSFGEGLPSFKRPGVFILQWSKDETKPKLYHLSIPTKNVVHFGQVIYHTDTELYATGYESSPDDRLLGIKFCFNRPFGIWRINVTSDTSDLDEYSTRECTADKLTPSHLSCRSPRILVSSAGTKLVYLSSETGGPHASTNSLNAFDLPYSPSAQSTTLVPIVQDADPKSFPGLYPPWTLSSSFTVNHPNWNAPKIVVSSTWRSRNTILLIDTQTGQIIDLTPVDESNWSWTLLTTDDQDRIVCVRSAPNVPHQVLLGTISATCSVDWRVIHEPTLTEELRTALLSIETKIIFTPNRGPVETVIIRSNFPSQASRCILAPHGGPHSGTTTEFNPITSAFALEGYTVALPNYTGSVGYGQSAILRLIGKCGSLDVQDCIQTLHHLVELGYAQLGRGKVFFFGGSHGGFLGAHLIGQFPDIFTAAALRNPVISVGEISTSDIPDWGYAEFGLQYPVPIASSPPTTISHSSSQSDGGVSSENAIPTQLGMVPEIYQKLYNASPLRFADKVTADVLLLIGKDDLRVAPTQGYGYYHTLKALRNGRGTAKGGSRVDMLVFDGESHPLNGVECERVCWEAARAWFLESAGEKGDSE